jgi:flagellar biosynthesis chaperone FliJ
MLIRISLIIAIVAGLAVGALNFVKIGKTITVLRTDLASEKGQKEKAQADLANTRRELEKTSTDLRHTKETLTATIAEKDTAVATATAANKRAGDLSEKLNKTVEERDDARANLEAYRVSGLTAAQVMNLGKQLKQTEDNLAGAQEENRVLGGQIKNLTAKLARYEGIDPTVRLPARLKGTILVSDPKWDFVVLNIGQDEGVLEYGELLVSRDGRLVAKVIVRSVQKNRCIANVMPGWKLGEVMEGDQVIPAHPASS